MMGSHNDERSGKRRGATYLNRYVIGWAVVLMVTMTDWIWISVCGYSVRESSVIALLKFVAISASLAVLLFGVARIPRYKPLTGTIRLSRVASTFAWFTLLASFVSVYDLLQYLCATVNAPLIDQRLVELDGVVGFHWLPVYLWVRAHPVLQLILGVAYCSIFIQGPAVLVILGVTGRVRELSEFVFLFMLSGVLLLLISTPIPASSAFLHFGITNPNTASSVSDFYLLRNGTLRVFDVAPWQGMVSMPSFHTTLAVLFVYALRGLPRVLLLWIPLNVMMILSTPTQGGHYLTDVFAGLLLSALTIALLGSGSRLIGNRIALNATPGTVKEGIYARYCRPAFRFSPTKIDNS
ncbi:phosphatase PAP2 family protein [Paraburkholderia sp. ZP32-5]|uniref:phosphatase PAP2 family protein n=1 Tax=Paraburkholderia sp. ZP32-5 TaxID=2883245 RepID=UPI001F242C97|nr:phosphatase PAP2 family protein [Paraburkholderia sp. ZP32-5]